MDIYAIADDILIWLARPEERTMLESLQRRASLNNPGDRVALLENPDAIGLPIDQIAHGCVLVAERRRRLCRRGAAPGR